jgi:hypothetical protein
MKGPEPLASAPANTYTAGDRISAGAPQFGTATTNRSIVRTITGNATSPASETDLSCVQKRQGSRGVGVV